MNFEARAKPDSGTRRKAARQVAEILASKLFKALCEPVRVEVLKLLIARGRSDVGTIAARFPQDGSVISRHLAILHDAGILRREKKGRHVFFELDGASVITQIEKILERFRNAVPLCCPPSQKK